MLLENESNLADGFNEKDFIDYVVKNGASPKTGREYYLKARGFLLYMDKFKQEKLNENRLFEKMFEYINTKKRTWGTRFAMLSYLRYKGKSDLVNRFNDKYRKKFKMKIRLLEKKSLSFKQIKTMVGILPMPHKIILMIEYDTACRVNDILNLKLRNIDADNDGRVKIIIKEEKTGNLRTLYLSPDTAYMLAKYIKQIKETLNISKDDNIFKVGYSLYTYHLKQAGKSIGEDNISSHWIRSSRAIHLLKNGHDIITIKNLLGHASIKTTEYYIREAGVNSKELIDKERPNWKTEV